MSYFIKSARRKCAVAKGISHILFSDKKKTLLHLADIKRFFIERDSIFLIMKTSEVIYLNYNSQFIADFDFNYLSEKIYKSKVRDITSEP